METGNSFPSPFYVTFESEAKTLEIASIDLKKRESLSHFFHFEFFFSLVALMHNMWESIFYYKIVFKKLICWQFLNSVGNFLVYCSPINFIEIQPLLLAIVQNSIENYIYVVGGSFRIAYYGNLLCDILNDMFSTRRVIVLSCCCMWHCIMDKHFLSRASGGWWSSSFTLIALYSSYCNVHS